VTSTCKDGWEGGLEPFRRWKKRKGPDGWDVYVAGDQDMEDSFERSLGEVWDSLEMQALKSDLLRWVDDVFPG